MTAATAPQPAWKLTYRPELDGVRGIAIALVVVAHAGVPWLTSGGLVGVTLFFVLSGYLITSLLQREYESTGRISIRSFYIRRARRLLPALGFLLAFAIPIGWIGGWELASILFYVGNWVRAVGGDLDFLGHTWSLAIEEQFYLVWPLVFVAGFRSIRWLLVAAIASVVLRLVLSGDMAAYATFARADGLVVGCALALAGTRLPAWAGLVGLALVVGLSVIPMSPALMQDVGVAAAVLASALLIAGAAPGVLSIRPLIGLGKISYALYLWHQPLITSLVIPGWAAVLLGLGFAIVSWYVVERPFRHRQRAKPAARRPTASAPALR